MAKDPGASLAEADEGEIRVTPLRWYVLAVFASCAFMQGLVWAIPGPISQVLMDDFDCDNDCDALLVNWGPIMFIIFTLPYAWFIDRSLRWSTISLALLVALSGWTRVAAIYTTDKSLVVTLLHIAQALNAAGGPVSMGAVSHLSQLWFPAGERSFATAVAAETNMMGVAVAFLLGPAMAPVGVGAGGLSALWWLLAVPPTAVLLLALVYLPDSPEHAPSRSARRQRGAADTAGGAEEHGHTLLAHDGLSPTAVSGSIQSPGASVSEPGSAAGWWRRLVVLVTNLDFAVLAMGYAFSAGVYSGWSPLLSINLRAVHVDETAAGWIGFCATMSGAAGGLLVGLVHARVGRIRPILLTLLSLATGAFVVFALACQPSGDGTVLPPSLPLLFASATVGGICVNALIPLMFEGSVEAVFGAVDEGTIGTVLALANNVCCLAFLVVPVGHGSTAWMNWTMAAAVAVFVLVFALWTERGRRKAIDDDAPAGHGRGQPSGGKSAPLLMLDGEEPEV